MNERMARVFSGCDSQMKHEEHRITLKRFREERDEGMGRVLHHSGQINCLVAEEKCAKAVMHPRV